MKRLRIFLLVIVGAVAWAQPPVEFVLQHRPKRMEPFRESRLQINPPTFRWPATKQLGREFRIELSRDPEFRDARIETVRDLWFRPLEPLAPGTWHWRCRVETPEPGPWLGTESFAITAEMPAWPVPEWRSLLARIPAGHPRVYVGPEDLNELRAIAERLSDRLRPRAEAIRRELAESFSLEPYIARASATSGPTVELVTSRRLGIIESKYAAMNASTPAVEGAWLAVATGDEAMFAAVKRRTLQLADFDPAGFISERTGGSDSANVDFGNSYLVHQLGVIYDLLYDRFSVEERRRIRAAIVARARPVFAKVAVCSLELMRAHAWQHGFLDVMVGALAVADEEPVVLPWLESGLKAFVAFYPWFGGNDGGSQEGTRYFHGPESLASLETVEVFRRCFGLRLEDGNPWFRGSPYFLIYSFPPGGAMARLGDSNGVHQRDHDDLQAPDGKSRILALGMAHLYGNGHAAAYAAMAPEEGYGFGVGHLLRWSRGATVEPVPLTTLPPARVFRDIGAVYTHSALTDPAENVRLVFHSSPYGGLGHSHADQNSFHVIAYGEDLLIDSGYYPAFNNADPHRLKWSVQTKAHNSILVDGVGQSWGDTRGHGAIRHFEQNDHWVYLVGSAGNAYPDAPLKQFDRHLVWLRGDAIQTYVIVDQLEAAGGTPRRFDWLLHAAKRMDVDETTRTVLARGEKAEAAVAFLEPVALTFQQDDQFDAPAMSWADGVVTPLPNQWHLKATSAASPTMRFVTVIQVSRPGVRKPALRAITGGVEVSGWRVRLPADAPRLSVERLP